MSSKKIASILSILEIAEKNLQTARQLMSQLAEEKGLSEKQLKEVSKSYATPSSDEDSALEVVEGYFDGESMVGDNGQVYPVPQNYASKTQLVIGDRMKWILTQERELFKLIQPTERERVIGTLVAEGEDFLVLVDSLPQPVRLLKASVTFAMKNYGLKLGDEVAIIIPKNGTPAWGAFSSVIKSGDVESRQNRQNRQAELDKFVLSDQIEDPVTADYF
jgi:hypothetical protein